ncbi:hypothetical protein AT15_06895 [Kosmotoga arenicorallina S304]|uniref:Cell envelope-related transcriptional attenuator domain-containing protein n=1 Tax=Kosmotoga arenicorallina S304 TaxID=1453497 RepID=A0A176K2D2_9BACT|nr:LCP family protein [Kosmotoga arenicorallina]OAA31218.1 hypothetical protein AT15_06895 [Kosmotoga arenicorallina S304]
MFSKKGLTSLVIVLLILSIIILQLIVYDVFTRIRSLENAGFFLILGTDSGGKNSLGGRTDFILALKTGKTGLVAVRIPRDTLVSWEGKSLKINALLNIYGIEALKNTVKSIIKGNCFGYIILDYLNVVKLTDFIGPVEVEITKPMHYDDFQQNLHIHFDPGIYELSGNELLGYLRYRYDASGDIGRIERQKEVMEKLVKNFRRLSLLDMLKTALFFLNTTQTEFDVIQSLGFVKEIFRSSLSISFESLPYYLDEKGNVILSEEPEKEVSEPRVLIINNIPGFKSFSEIVKGQWLSRTGLHVDTVDMYLHTYNIEQEETVIFINNPADEIIEFFGAAHPLHKPEVFRTYLLQGVEEYYSLLDEYSKNRYYISDYDYIVLLGNRK